MSIITTFGDRGAVSTRTELIRETYCDLPHRTALTYRQKFPDAAVEIIAQAPAAPEGRGRRDRVETETHRAPRRPKPGAPAEPGIRTADYADVVNTMMREAR